MIKKYYPNLGCKITLFILYNSYMNPKKLDLIRDFAQL